jgi:hypothetical protein
MLNLSLICTFYNGDIAGLQLFMARLSSYRFKGISQLVVVSTGTNFLTNQLTNASIGLPAEIQLTVIESTVRRSQATARNMGIAASTCDLISIHDGDDFPHPSKFVIAKHIFSSIEALDWLCHDTLPSWEELIRTPIEPGGLSLLTNPSVPRKGEAPQFEGGRSASGASALIFRRRVAEKVRYSEKAENYRHEDTEFIWRIFCESFEGAYLPIPLSTYVSSQGPDTQNLRKIEDFVYFSKFIDGNRDSLKQFLAVRGVHPDSIDWS